MIKFRLDCDPPIGTAQQKGIRIIPLKTQLSRIHALWQGGPKNLYAILRLCTPMHYIKPKEQLAKDYFLLALKQHRPTEPIMGPIAIEIDWVWPWRKSELKGRINSYDRYPCDKRPDCGNLSKSFIDCMTKTGYFGDDSQIYDERFRKWWGSKPGIEVRIIHGDELPVGPIAVQPELITE